MDRTFARSFDSLSSVYEFAEEIMLAGNIPDAGRFPVQLALEELFVNMVKYNPGVTTDIEVTVEISGTVDEVTVPEVAVTMVDDGGVEFDVTKPRDVDIDAPLDERTPGGLGIHLIQTLVDNLSYEYENGRGTVKFTKESGT